MKFKNFDLNYFVTLFFLLISANANFFATTPIAWFAVMLLMTVVAVYKKAIDRKEIRIISTFAGVYLLLVSFRFFVINDYEIDYYYSDLLFLFKYIYLAWIVAVILRETAFANIVKVMAHLTIISLVFFAFQLLSPETMFRLFSSMNISTGNTIPGYSNIVLFTFTQGFHDYSNSGFVWEPGAFGCFLVLTLLMHFFLNKFRFDGLAWLFIIANITTFSTTNYLGLMVLLFLAYRYRVPKINFYVLVLVAAIVLAFIFIPFLQNKIVDTYVEDMRDLKHLKMLEKWYHHNRMEIPLNRFSSMVYIYEQFQGKLILGVSSKYNDILNKSYTVNISNGIFDFMAKMGLVGFLALMVYYVRMCKPYVLRWENIVYCVLILLALSFGEPILFLPIVMIFFFVKIDQIPFSRYSAERERRVR